MLLRDTDQGPEVFMLKRTMNAAFVGGFYVFPGGVVDLDDGGSAVESLCTGLTDSAASTQLNVSTGGLAFWVAAVRECFEEAGVMLAAGVDFSDEPIAERFNGYRHDIHDRKLGIVELCRNERLTLDVGSIEYIAHWITPRVESRRFDTRFFVTRMPAGQTPLHDDKETIDSEWIRPNVGLERQAAGEWQMLPPTIAMLRFLADHDDVDAAMAAAAAITTPPPIQPVAIMKDGKFVDLLLPGDARYDDAFAAELAQHAEG